MDSPGEEAGLKGGTWEERTDWAQQLLRTLCLACASSLILPLRSSDTADGAACFYTSQTQPNTYTLLRAYVLHRLYAEDRRFPFPHRANVLDRDAMMVPSGWDSWGKINILRDGFDPARVEAAWITSLARARDTGDRNDDDNDGVESMWEAMIPVPARRLKVRSYTSKEDIT